MLVLDSASSALSAASAFAVLATGGVADTAVRLVNRGQGLLAEAGLSTEAQYGVAGVAGGACIFLAKMVIGYHERMLADRDKQIAELHARVIALESKRDAQAEAVLKAGLENFDGKP